MQLQTTSSIKVCLSIGVLSIFVWGEICALFIKVGPGPSVDVGFFGHGFILLVAALPLGWITYGLARLVGWQRLTGQRGWIAIRYAIGWAVFITLAFAINTLMA